MVEALQEDKYNLDNIGTTWGSRRRFRNGPIVRSSASTTARGGLLIFFCARRRPARSGERSASSIRNIGGYLWPAKNQIGTFGYPINFCFAGPGC